MVLGGRFVMVVALHWVVEQQIFLLVWPRSQSRFASFLLGFQLFLLPELLVQACWLGCRIRGCLIRRGGLCYSSAIRAVQHQCAEYSTVVSFLIRLVGA
jgi:hypothetical protein